MSTPRTVKDYLNELPEPYRLVALENMRVHFEGKGKPHLFQERLKQPVADLCNAITNAFTWSHTAEGHGFWRQVSIGGTPDFPYKYIQPEKRMTSELHHDLSPRQQAYNAIDNERTYQDAKWPEHKHSALEFSVYMKDYLEELQHLCSRNDDRITGPEVMNIMRKVTAMGVACMEQHGAPLRENQIKS